MAALLLFAACGQNEGGRCQVNSDCASGLTCSDNSGNGVCRNPNVVVTNDAALNSDVAEDQSASISVEVGPEAAAMPEIDADSVDSGSVDSSSGSLDSTGLD